MITSAKSMRNMLLTPHCPGDCGLPYTVDTLTKYFCRNLRRYTEGEELIKIVDPAVRFLVSFASSASIFETSFA